MDSSIIRVSHFSTTFTGGAGIAARTLNTKLLELGVRSTFLTLQQPGFIPNNGENEIIRKKSEIVLSSLNGRLQSKLSKKSYFSLYSFVPSAVNKLIRNNEKDSIIHIHNWFNLIDLKTLNQVAKSGFKIVLTLHDERNYTGGCHSTLGCKNFHKNCAPCPGLTINFMNSPFRNLMKAKNSYQGLFESATFIAPSKWIMSQAQSSLLLRNSNVVFIPNVISAQPINFAPKRISLPIKIGFAAIDPNSYIKGGDFYRDISEYSSSNKDRLQIYNLRDYANNMIDFWKTIDILCVPSIADNSPNVIHEAKILGKPVIARETGGIPELLNSKFDILIKPGVIDFEALLESIEETLLKLSNRDNAKWAKNEYDKYAGDSLNKHIDLYEQILESH